MDNVTADGRPPLALCRARRATATRAPIVFSAAGRLPDLAPGIVIAAVSTAGYGGFLAGPPLIDLGGLPPGLGLVPPRSR